jgi:hypothetical protein
MSQIDALLATVSPGQATKLFGELWPLAVLVGLALAFIAGLWLRLTPEDPSRGIVARVRRRVMWITPLGLVAWIVVLAVMLGLDRQILFLFTYYSLWLLVVFLASWSVALYATLGYGRGWAGRYSLRPRRSP